MKKKKFNWGALLLAGGSLVAGMACGFIMVQMMDLESLSIPEMFLELALNLIVMSLTIWLQTAVHEAGHLVFGLLTGYGFSSYRLGSLMILKENGKLRLRRHKVAGTGGQCLMTPPELVEGKMPFVLYNLGGCIANLAASVAALVLFLLLPQIRLLSFGLLSMTAFGLIQAATNGIPLKAGLVQNDGRNTLNMSRQPDSLRVFHYQLRMVEAMSRGVRLKDMPDEWFWIPSADDKNDPIATSAGVIYCNRLMDAHRFDEARQSMENLLNGNAEMLDLHRRMLTLDVIYCELIGQRRWDVVEGMLTKEQKNFMQAMRTNIGVLRTQYLLALCHENDSVKARAYLAQFEKQAKIYPYPSEVESERELIAIAGERRLLTNGI